MLVWVVMMMTVPWYGWLLAAVILAAAVIWAALSSDSVWHDAFSWAERKDLRYFRDHPDCTWFEAHHYREIMHKLFRR